MSDERPRLTAPHLVECFWHRIRRRPKRFSKARSKRTPRTVVNPKALRALLALVNEQGYALDMGEHEPEVRCVAAPIRNHSGAAIAAMSVSGPAQRIEPMLTEGLVTEVVGVARAISGLLGYLGSDRARTVDETAAT